MSAVFPGRRLPLLLLAALAALLSLVLHVTLFRQGSLDNDEVAYLLQARALTHGQLFLPVPDPATAYQPWFFAVTDAGYVSKYLPVVSAVFAASLLLTGSIAPVLALLAAALVVLTAALARETGLDERASLGAAALVSLSPLMLLQSALALSYLLFLVLIVACWLLLLRIRRRAGGAGAAAGLGVLAVLAGSCRPYDALLLLLVPGAVVLRSLRGAPGRPGRLGRLGLAAGAGAVPPLVAVLAYNSVATGSALRLPFGLLEPSDKLGFGVRRLVPQDPTHDFGLWQGLSGLLTHFVALPLTWFALGLLLLPAAAIAVRRAGAPMGILLAAGGTLLLGYLPFWGPWNATLLWGGTRVVGPFYAMPLLVPVTLAALPVLRQLRTRAPRLVLAGIVLALLGNAAQLGVAVSGAAGDAGRTERVVAAVSAWAPGRVLVDADPPYLGHPVGALVDDLTARGAAPRFALASRAAVPAGGAPLPALLSLPDDAYASRQLNFRLARAVRSSGAQVRLVVDRVGTGGAGEGGGLARGALGGDLLVVERAGRPSACRLALGIASVTVTPDAVLGCAGAAVPTSYLRDPTRRCADAGCVTLAFYRPGGRDGQTRVQWRRLPVATDGGQVALLTDGATVAEAGRGWVSVVATG